MQERRMKASIKAVGSFWYTAWINAGQPDLDNLKMNKIKSNATYYKTIKALKSKRQHDS